MEQRPPTEAVTQVVKKSPAFYGTLSFITVFTGAHHWVIY